MWDERDRKADELRVARGDLVLADGHETPATTVVDGELDEVLDMPSDSAVADHARRPRGAGLRLPAHRPLDDGAGVRRRGAAVLAAWHWREGEAEPAVRHAARAAQRLVGDGDPAHARAALLGSMIGTYFYLHFTSPAVAAGRHRGPEGRTADRDGRLLVASTLPFAAATAAVKRGARAAAWWLIAGGLALQAVYIAVQIVEYISDLETFGPDTNAYGSIYFTLIGTHHAHVIVGILLNLWLLTRLASGLTHYRAVGVRAVALYWYVIAALEIAVVATQVSAG